MPHFTIEYSANLDTRLDMGKVVEVVRKAAVETGIFPLGGIRVRAVKCKHYAIADGNPQTIALNITVDDPVMYTKPWSVTMTKRMIVDDELIEWICENERDLIHMVGK